MTTTASPPGSPHDKQIVHVALSARAYDIHIGSGLLNHAGAYIAPLLRRPRVAIVTDSNVAKLHLPALQAALAEAGIGFETIIIEAGEASKSFAQLETLCGALMDHEIERDDCILAFGGGVIGDLTGFAAAILRRGTRFIQIPTSLLAQVDSSIGGKTAINAGQGKNLIGAFHQPDLVLADMDVLASLPPRQVTAGYAEIVKYGALGNAEFFHWLDANYASVLALDPDAMAHAVAESCRAKAAIVARDEREAGDRALLNLGHTFGHAFEKLTDYSDALLHGEGVGYGIVLAFALSAARGYCPLEDAERVQAHMQKVGLPVQMSQIGNGNFGVEALIDAMRQDKKVQAGNMRFILARQLGESFVSDDVGEDELRAFLIHQGAQL
ncbi:3-dehydroquinate synthase [Alphaproteobacteria bacterium]|nr:3-dehydroquinate synthase [Alphaproteobacteria bacterium]MDC1241085.1 3-dehydroquinate synthase [bacterium]